MKAWLFTSASGGLEKNLHLSDSAPLPPTAKSLPPDHTLVQVIACALNPVDHKVVEIPVVGGFVVKTPSSPGIDFAGRVVATGANTNKVASDDLRPGQLVFCMLGGPTQYGPLGEYTVVSREGCVPLPSGVDPVDASGIGVAGSTAYQCIVPKAKKGDNVFINGGSGGTGTFGIQIAKAIGCDVTTTCSTANVELCKSLGADEVIDYKKQDIVEALKKSGKKYDLVVDNVGHDTSLYWRCHEYTSSGAQYVQVGAPSALLGFAGIAKMMVWPTLLGGGKRPYQFLGAKTKYEDLKQIGQWMQEGKVKAIIDQKFAFEDAPKAFEKLKTGRAKGKVVVEVAQ